MSRFAKPWDFTIQIGDLLDLDNPLTMVERCQFMRDRMAPIVEAIRAKDADEGQRLEDLVWEFENLQDDAKMVADGTKLPEGAHTADELTPAFNYALSDLYDFGDAGKRIWFDKSFNVGDEVAYSASHQEYGNWGFIEKILPENKAVVAWRRHGLCTEALDTLQKVNWSKQAEAAATSAPSSP